MSDKRLSFLGILAIVSVIAAVFVLQFANREKATSAGPGNLIQGLNPEAVAEIAAGKSGEIVNLKRKQGGFAVANKDDYPASSSRINDLFAACLDIRCVELYTEDKANHKDLGVTEENANGVVKFLDLNGKIITGVIAGNPRRDGSTAYGRLINDDKVYIIYNPPWVRSSPLDYIETELISLNKADIASVSVTLPDEAYTLVSEANGTEVVLQQQPAGKMQKKNDCDSVFSVLTNLRFDDVNAAADKTDLNFDRQYTCLLKDSTLYTISIAQKDSKTFVKCSAEFTDKTPVKKEQAVESEEELKKKEAKLLAKDKAKKFQETCDGWIYQISSYKAKNMTRQMSELVEDIPAQGPTDANTSQDVTQKSNIKNQK